MAKKGPEYKCRSKIKHIQIISVARRGKFVADLFYNVLCTKCGHRHEMGHLAVRSLRYKANGKYQCRSCSEKRIKQYSEAKKETGEFDKNGVLWPALGRMGHRHDNQPHRPLKHMSEDSW